MEESLHHKELKQDFQMLMRNKLIVTTGNANLYSLFNCRCPNAHEVLRACRGLLEIVKTVHSPQLILIRPHHSCRSQRLCVIRQGPQLSVGDLQACGGGSTWAGA